MFDYSDIDFDDSTQHNSSIGIDIDGDGMVDIIASDTNYDGLIDTVVLDSDCNGTFDTIIEDTNYDGKADSIASFSYNTDFEPFSVYSYDSEQNFESSMYDLDYFDYPHERCFAYDLVQYDPDNYLEDLIHGVPDTAMSYWEYQGDTNRCALYSQKFIIQELTGKDIDIDEIANLAEENSWFSEEYGTSAENINRILDYYGIENEMSYGNSLDDIKNNLDNGNKVMVSIDADEIWYGELDDIYTPGDEPNHAVEVIGVVDAQDGNNMVVLNDSGNPSGQGVMVPEYAFVDAWQDGGCQMVTCYC